MNRQIQRMTPQPKRTMISELTPTARVSVLSHRKRCYTEVLCTSTSERTWHWPRVDTHVTNESSTSQHEGWHSCVLHGTNENHHWPNDPRTPSVYLRPWIGPSSHWKTFSWQGYVFTLFSNWICEHRYMNICLFHYLKSSIQVVISWRLQKSLPESKDQWGGGHLRDAPSKSMITNTSLLEQLLPEHIILCLLDSIC